MQISELHVVVVVVVVVRRVVVVGGGLRVVVVVVVFAVVVVVVAVVVLSVVVVVVVLEPDSDPDGADCVVVVVGPADCEAGGIGSTAPNSDGSRSGPPPSVSVPRVNSVHTIAPTTAPTARRPWPCCRVDPISVSFG
jgi:hypothetical protein